jgi:hypothetical protein
VREVKRERGEEAMFNLGNIQKFALEETLILTLWMKEFLLVMHGCILMM